ncbi:MAG: G1 family glutamic endopeptidase [Thermoguttaceae bacterium]
MKAKGSLGKRLAFESLENRLLLSTTTTSSTNWSGYSISTGAGTVTKVTGTWTVPTVTASIAATYESTWVGIDGYGTSTVEQIGTTGYSKNGSTSYWAWYEMYPAASVKIVGMNVYPGDLMSASVTYVTSGTYAGKFLLQIANMTRSNTFHTYQSLSSATRTTAEWVVERPSVNGTVSTLANFGSQYMYSCTATVSGTTGAISNWNNYRINMVSGGTTLASTSALTTSGSSSSFTVTYVSSGASSSSYVSSSLLSGTKLTSLVSNTPSDNIVNDTVSADVTDVALPTNVIDETIPNVWEDSGFATHKLSDFSESMIESFDTSVFGRTAQHEAEAADSVFASFGAELEVNVL